MKKEIKILGTGILLILLFAVWTLMIQVVDVRLAGETYAVTFTFLMLVIKAALLFKCEKAER